MRKLAIAVLVLAVALAAPRPAAAVPYTYTKIADDTGAFEAFGVPAINANGVVAFQAKRDDGTFGIFKSDGTTLTTIATSGATYSSLGSLVAIDSLGRVAFNATLTSAGPTSETGIFRGDGVLTTMIADTTGIYSAFSPVSINAGGTVVAYAERDAGGADLITGSGGALTVLYNSFAFSAVPSINAGGTAAFRSVGGTTGFFKGDGSASATQISTVTGGGEPAINDAGVVAFSTTGGGGALYTGDGTTTTTIADGSNGFTTFYVGPQINNDGAVAFMADFAGGTGIFTGPDSTADRVVKTGDILDGHTVTGLNFFRGFNDDGQVAFLMFGSQGIYRADPASEGGGGSVPVPGSLALFVGGVGAVALRLIPSSRGSRSARTARGASRTPRRPG